MLSIWIFIEAQTEKTQLDTHYSFLNRKFQGYVEDYNYVLIEDDIVKAISFNRGIYGTTAVLVDAANIFDKIALRKKTRIRTVARETHGL